MFSFLSIGEINVEYVILCCQPMLPHFYKRFFSIKIYHLYYWDVLLVQIKCLGFFGANKIYFVAQVNGHFVGANELSKCIKAPKKKKALEISNVTFLFDSIIWFIFNVMDPLMRVINVMYLCKSNTWDDGLF